MIKLPSSFDRLSTEELYTKLREPLTAPAVRLDSKPLPHGVPSLGTVPTWLEKKADQIPPAKAHLILSDFGEVFSPVTDKLIGDEFHALFTVLAPQTYIETDKSVPFPSYVRALVYALWSDNWDERRDFFIETGHPKAGRFVFLFLEQLFEQQIQG